MMLCDEIKQEKGFHVCRCLSCNLTQDVYILVTCLPSGQWHILANCIHSKHCAVCANSSPAKVFCPLAHARSQSLHGPSHPGWPGSPQSEDYDSRTHEDRRKHWHDLRGTQTQRLWVKEELVTLLHLTLRSIINFWVSHVQIKAFYSF